MLQFVQVSHEYPGRRVLDRLTFSLGSSEVVALFGPSGSGKSTVLGLTARFFSPTSGAIEWERALSIGHVFQRPLALMRRSTLDNVALAAIATGAGRVDAEAASKRALAAVGLEGHIDARALTLSGGQLQRLTVARAVVAGPDLVIADEPTSELDPVATTQVIEALRAVAQLGAGVLVATHDPRVAAGCDRTISLRGSDDSAVP